MAFFGEENRARGGHVHNVARYVKFVMAYLDNIIIYFNIEEEYKEYIKWVLKKLYEENIPVTVEKCEFYTKKTDFMGFIIKLR